MLYLKALVPKVHFSVIRLLMGKKQFAEAIILIMIEIAHPAEKLPVRLAKHSQGVR